MFKPEVIGDHSWYGGDQVSKSSSLDLMRSYERSYSDRKRCRIFFYIVKLHLVVFVFPSNFASEFS